MRVLVIGGAGFIGCNIADHYLKRNSKVSILDNFSRIGALSNLEWLQNRYKKRLNIVHGDIRVDRRIMEELVDPHDVIFHMAAQVAVTTSIISPRDDFETNAVGTFNILEAIRKSKNKPVLIFASTNKVYGALEDIELIEKKERYDFKGPCVGIAEDRSLDFHSPYGCSKGTADQYVRDYSRIYGLKTIVFRQSCIYGWRQFGIEDQGWIAHFIISSILNRPLTIYGSGKQVRDILFIDDLIRAFDLAISKLEVTSGQAYNIGGGPQNQISLLEFVKLLRKILRKKIPLSFADWREGDQPIFVSNISKAKMDFDWEPRINVNEGVNMLTGWIKKNRQLF